MDEGTEVSHVGFREGAESRGLTMHSLACSRCSRYVSLRLPGWPCTDTQPGSDTGLSSPWQLPRLLNDVLSTCCGALEPILNSGSSCPWISPTSLTMTRPLWMERRWKGLFGGTSQNELTQQWPHQPRTDGNYEEAPPNAKSITFSLIWRGRDQTGAVTSPSTNNPMGFSI